MSNKNTIEEEKYYVPFCREKGCNGHLYTQLDENFFRFNCFCEKNQNHDSKLYFETFDRFYLKEILIKKCFNCNINLDNKSIYKCTKCNKIYCPFCFKSDKHIQENLKNLNIIKNVCPKDQNELTDYCVNCGIKICSYCFMRKVEESEHRNHQIKTISFNIPSFNEINILKEKIRQKSESFDKLLESLEEWQVKLNKKIEHLKQNLRNEIKILKKIYFNFNNDYNEYVYYSNFYNSINNLRDYINRDLKKFMETPIFEEKTWSIFNVLTCKEDFNGSIPQPLFLPWNWRCKLGDKAIIENFDEQLMLQYDNNYIKLLIFDKKTGYFLEAKEKYFSPQISSFHFSSDKTKIYAILEEKNSINIYNFNKKYLTLELSDEKIEFESKDNIKKCIPINENNLILFDKYIIYLLSKEGKIFSVTKKLDLKMNIFDACLINDKYILSTGYFDINFVTIENLTKEKTIHYCSRIDKRYYSCIDKINTIILLNDYVLLNCEKWIAVVSIKTKEIIQIVEYIFGNRKSNIMTKSFDNIIYVWNSENIVCKYIYSEYGLKLIGIINCLIEFNNPNNNVEKNIIAHNFFVNNGNLIIWFNSMFLIINEHHN